MENRLDLEKGLLVCIEPVVEEKDEGEYLYMKANFCGLVLDTAENGFDAVDLSVTGLHSSVYACGNIQLLREKANSLPERVKVIREFSYSYEGESRVEIVSLGEVPINLHKSAVYYRNCLSSGSDEKSYFELLQAKHQFQALTESNKPGTSFRKGAYLSEVETDGDASKFHLLRCSTNLSGPTLAFADEDREILRKVNDLARRHFDQATELNHVLAQVYENSVTINEWNKAKEHKARIKSHSDKTKDMPANGLIAFCTFYSSEVSSYTAPSHDCFDRNFKDASVLTQLRFRLKDAAKHLPLSKDFRVTLYPNSVLLIPLSTNRLYTHEVVPPTLPVGKFPTRLGYVVRCSKTKAVFRDGATFIERKGQEDVPLTRPTKEEFAELKGLYMEENVSAKVVLYPDIWFSMNEGDFQAPQVG